MPLSHYTHVLTQSKIHCRAKRKLTTHRQRRLLLIWNKISGLSAFKLCHFKEIKSINTVLWLFNVSWQITALPQFKHVNRTSFHINLKHDMNMNKHQTVFYLNRGIQHFSSLSPPKLICSSVWFVVKARRETAEQNSRFGSIRHSGVTVRYVCDTGGGAIG